MIRLQIVVVTLLGVLLGCSPVLETRTPLNFPKEKDVTLFGVGSVTKLTMTNQSGKPIDGVVLQDASLIRDAKELAASKHQHYVLFRGFLLGNLLTGRYWEQQSEKQKGLGLPVMDNRLSVVTIVTINSNGIITNSQSIHVAHAQISVDTNDFTRPFTP